MSDITNSERGDHIHVTIAPDGIKHWADSPAPFIYVDYDVDDNMVGFSASGPAVQAAITIYRDWLAQKGEGPALDEQLQRWQDLTTA